MAVLGRTRYVQASPTSAARGGFGEAAIMKHGRWKSAAVARRYIRAGNRWNDSVSVL